MLQLWSGSHIIFLAFPTWLLLVNRHQHHQPRRSNSWLVEIVTGACYNVYKPFISLYPSKMCQSNISTAYTKIKCKWRCSKPRQPPILSVNNSAAHFVTMTGYPGNLISALWKSIPTTAAMAIRPCLRSTARRRSKLAWKVANLEAGSFSDRRDIWQ